MTSSETMAQLQKNLVDVQNRIATACEKAGRKQSSVNLIAVTKYAPAETWKTLIELGVTQLGESRPQQLAERGTAVLQNKPLLTSITQWHMIGHLQRNKVRLVLPHVSFIHSVDSSRLAERISQVSQDLKITTNIFLEANVSGDVEKDGFDEAGLKLQIESILALPCVNVVGLMGMASRSRNTDDARTCFQKLRQLRDEIQQTLPAASKMTELSMGMSGDFEIAIEEGATFIRVGSALFQGLDR